MDEWELLGQPPRRGAAGQLAPFPMQMGLVIEPRADRDASQPEPVRGTQQPLRELEPHHPGSDLGHQAELVAESGAQVPPAPTHLPGQGGHLDTTVAGRQPAPRPAEFRRGTVALPGDPG